MQLKRTKPAPIKDSIKSGIVAGQAAAWAIFAVILAIDSFILTPPGTFYKVIGMALGQSPATDVYVGFLMHMIAATVIGIAYMIISDRVKVLYISSVFKGLATGPITGVVVWAILFLPLHLAVIQPMLQTLAEGISPEDVELAGHLSEISNEELAARLVGLSDMVIAGSLAMHILFGCVLGFLGRLGTSSRDMLE